MKFNPIHFIIVVFSSILFSVNTNAQTTPSLKEVMKITSLNREIDQQYGNAVHMDENQAIIGAKSDSKDIAGGNELIHSGAAYLLKKDSLGNWTQEQKIVASDRGANNFFGWAVAVSNNYAVSGAYLAEGQKGAAYVFEKNSSGTWVEVAKLTASDGAVNDYFGYSVNINGDYIAVGAILQDTDESNANYLSGGGAVYVFERNASGNWIQTQKIINSNRSSGDNFGRSVTIAGNTLAVGANSQDYNDQGINYASSAGAAYVFERNPAGVWNETQKLTASDRETGSEFGYDLASTSDYLVIGAYKESKDTANANPVNEAGAAYVFEKDVSGTWNEVKKLVATNRITGDNFGKKVAIYNNQILVGALNQDLDTNNTNSLTNAGAAYLFERTLSGNWYQKQKITATNRHTSDEFGFDVAIAGDFALIGTPGNKLDELNLNTKQNAGATYLFKTTTNTKPYIANPIADQILCQGNTNHTIDLNHAFQDNQTVDSNLIFEVHKGKNITATILKGIATISITPSWNGLDTFYITAKDEEFFNVTQQVTFNITPLKTIDHSLTICSGEQVNNKTYYNSGEYRDTLQSLITGCDSVSLLHLTILTPNKYLHEVEKVTSDNRVTNQSFGNSVKIHGNTALIRSGKQEVFIYEKQNSGAWLKKQKITFHNYSGPGIAMDIENNTAVFGDVPQNGVDFGRIYIYEKDTAGTWSQTQIVIPNISRNNRFGERVYINNGTIFVKAIRNYDPYAVGFGQSYTYGSIYVYSKINNDKWSQQQKIGVGQHSGFAVSDQFLITIVTNKRTSSSNTDPGYAVIHEKDSSGNYQYTTTLSQKSDGSYYHFRGNIAIDDQTAIVEHGYLVTPGTTIIERQSDGQWTQKQKLEQYGPITYANDRLLIANTKNGTDECEKNTLSDAGASYLYLKDGNGMWQMQQKLIASDRSTSDQFGSGGVAMSDNNLLIGTPYEDENAAGDNTMSASGSAYFFQSTALFSLPEAVKPIDSKYICGDFSPFTIDLNSVFEDKTTSDSNLIYTVSGNNIVDVTIVKGIATITKKGYGAERVTFTATDEDNLSGTASFNLVSSPIANDTIATTICQGENYSFNGKTIVASGVYTDTLLTVNGCDSIITINLTVLPISTDSISASFCSGSYYQFNGMKIDLAGKYIKRFPNNINGCDSLQVLTLTEDTDPNCSLFSLPEVVKPIDSKYICGDFSPFTIDLNSVFEDKTTSDSNLIYTVTGNNIVDVTIVKGIATITKKGYGAETVTFTATDEDNLSGTASFNLVSSPIANDTIATTNCQGENYSFNGKTIVASGVYTDTLLTVNGCDSIITINLTVMPISTDSISASFCSGSYYQFDGMKIDLAGKYIKTFPNNINGCDSLQVLTLTEDTDPNCSLLTAAEISEEQLDVYPNPSFGRLFVSKNVQEVRIYSINGSLIKSITNIKNEITHYLNKGVYFVRLQGKNGTVVTKKIIVLE